MNPAAFWRATRAYSLPASIVPVLLGTILAARGYANFGRGHFDLVAFFIVLIGAVFAHIGANVLNDYFDFLYGVDTRPEHGSGVLTGRLLTPRQALIFSALLFVGAALCGLLLLRAHPGVVAPLAALGLGCAVLYSALLKKYALGDLLIILSFGLGLTLGAYGIQAGQMSGREWGWIAFYSVPVCLLVDAILHANNLRDVSDDRGAKVRTLATLLPLRGGQFVQIVLVFGPLVFVAVGILLHLLPIWSAATFLATPFLIRAYRSGSVEGTAQTHLIFGLLYALSFLPPR